MTTATVRWTHSIQAFESSSGGRSWPWQSGQSGQPRPGIGGAHDDPDRDQPESGREGERGELLEAVHEGSF